MDRYGYLEFRSLHEDPVTFRVTTPLTTFASGTFRLALVLANVCYTCRDSFWWREALTYNRVCLLGSSEPDCELRPLGEWRLEAPDLCPVPDSVAFPPESWVTEARAYNTVRHDLFGRTGSGDGPSVDGDFPDSSRVYGFHDATTDTLDLFTGPEFVRSDSYWLFTRIAGARPGVTRLRLNAASGYAKERPGMSPRLFWSPDRETWEEAPLVEPTDEMGRYYPLITAPAESFYLSTSIPFMQTELAELLIRAEDIGFVEDRTIGHSVEGRPITLLTMTDSSVPSEDKTHVVLTIGQHSPMEMVGAHFIDPILRYLDGHREALRSLVLDCVPIVNMDCAAHGSDGMNLNLQNTNRCWFENLQPETRCIIDHYEACSQPPDLFLDIHSGGCWRNHTLLRLDPEFLREHFGKEGDRLVDEQMEMNLLLERHAGIRCIDGVDHVFRRCCAKDWFKVRFPDCISCDLELSLCTYFDPIDRITRPVDQRSLEVVGTGLAKAIQAFASNALT